VAHAENETPLSVEGVCRQACEFVDPGKAASVELGPPGVIDFSENLFLPGSLDDFESA
jgi:hypothetical protein